MSNLKLKGVYILDESARQQVYSPAQQAEIEQLIDVSAGWHSSDTILGDLQVLSDMDVILTGWGGPKMSQTVLDAAPNLKAVFYAAGSVRGIVTSEFWKAGIPITAAGSMNAIPVAEYTLSQILFCLKLGWQHHLLRETRNAGPLPVHGGYRSTVGLISLGTIGKLVRKYLKQHDVNVLVFDPYVTEEMAAEWEVELVSLEAVFEGSAVVSLHAPDLPETKRMVGREHFQSMLPWSSFINTARSATVCHQGLCDVLERRSDLWAVLDVTEEASVEDYRRLEGLPNVTITPHIAGSLGPECHRMGKLMVDELKRFLSKKSLEHQITEDRARIMA